MTFKAPNPLPLIQFHFPLILAPFCASPPYLLSLFRWWWCCDPMLSRLSAFSLIIKLCFSFVIGPSEDQRPSLSAAVCHFPFLYCDPVTFHISCSLLLLLLLLSMCVPLFSRCQSLVCPVFCHFPVVSSLLLQCPFLFTPSHRSIGAAFSAPVLPVFMGPTSVFLPPSARRL